MGSALPLGEPVPARRLAAGRHRRSTRPTPFGVYLHVPFCRVRCGYCDFNTYTSGELQGARQDQYADTLLREVALARDVLTSAGGIRPASHGVLRRRHADAAAAGRSRADARRRPRDVRHRRRRRGHRRGQPRHGDAMPSPPSSPHPESRGCRSGCSPRSRTCSRRSTAPTTRRMSRTAVEAARACRARREPRPHLRRTGGVARRLAALARRRRSRSRPTTSRRTR